MKRGDQEAINNAAWWFAFGKLGIRESADSFKAFVVAYEGDVETWASTTYITRLYSLWEKENK